MMAAVVCLFPNCGKQFAKIQYMRTHMTLKHVGESGSAKRARVETDDSAAAAEQDEGLDWDLTGDVDQEYERRWHAGLDIHEHDRELGSMEAVALQGTLSTQMQLYNSTFSADCNLMPSWEKLNKTADELALLERLPRRDLVAEDLLTYEELDLTKWAIAYNISMAAHDNLQRRLRAENDVGDALFTLSNLRRTVNKQREVMDAAVPEYLRSASGPLLTKTALDVGDLKQVTVEGRNIRCVLVELVKEYEDYIDFDLSSVIENGVRIYDGRIASGDRAQTVKTVVDRQHPGGYTILVQLHSDKTLYGSRESLWPMYVTLLSIHPELRSMQETRRLVAFFPVLRGAYVTGSNRRRGQGIWQQILSWLLEPFVDMLHVSAHYVRC
jgi:hypothetical protein